MNIEELRDYCLGKKGVTEEFPFDEDTLVFKVAGKMFLLTDLKEAFSINVKCDPEKGIELREKYPAVLPGYHMNKKHWNTILINGSLSENLIYQWVDESYDLVVKKLSRKFKQSLSEKRRE